jgi:glutamate racemase
VTTDAPRLAAEPSSLGPIGVFDSGVGGLTVVAALRRQLPGESILYLGDTARLPYGIKTATTVRRYTRRNVEFLVERGVRAVVVACNTASAIALDGLDTTVPLWGVVEPGARRAAELSAGRVGVIGTESTILSDAYPQALRRLRPDLEIASRACPLFVPLVEEGWHEDEITETIARRYLEPLLEQGIDTLVLGCTHYPLLEPLLQRVAGTGVRLVDSAEAVAATVAADLDPVGEGRNAPEHHFCVTDGPDRFGGLARRILGDSRVSLELVEMA